jgi:hypothetical protein
MGYKNWKDTVIFSSLDNYYPTLDMVFLPRDSSGQFFKNPSPLGYTITTGNYNTGAFFPTGFGSVFTPYISQQVSTVINSETIISTGYWLWASPQNRSFDLTYPVPPGNGDCFIVEESMVDSRISGNVKMTGYAIPQSVASTGTCSGLYWFGNIPTGAVQFDVNLTIRSLEHPNYVGGIAPYVTIGSYLIDSFSNVPTGSGDMRLFFTGSINGLIRTPYIGRVAFRNPALLDVQTDLTGYIGAYSFINELRQYNVPVGLAIQQNNIFTGGYSYFDENNILLMQFRLNWSSPCPSGVIGC